MRPGAGDSLSPDLVMWACSVCEKSNKHSIRLSVLTWMYMTFHSKFKKWHARKKTYTKHCKFNLIPASFTYSPSMEKVIPLLEIIPCSRADCHTTQVFIAYLRSLKKTKHMHAYIPSPRQCNDWQGWISACCGFYILGSCLRKCWWCDRQRNIRLSYPDKSSEKMEFRLWKEHPKGQNWRKDFSWDMAFDFRVIFSSKLFNLHNYNYQHNYISNNYLQWR